MSDAHRSARIGVAIASSVAHRPCGIACRNALLRLHVPPFQADIGGHEIGLFKIVDMALTGSAPSQQLLDQEQRRSKIAEAGKQPIECRLVG